jgi:hypothetical protein
MKKLLTGIALLTISLGTAFAQQSNSVSRHTWILDITPKTHKAYLDSVSAAWKAHGIMLTFSTLEYNNQGQLVNVKGSVSEQVSGRSNVNGTFSSDKQKTIEIKVTDSPSVDIRTK